MYACARVCGKLLAKYFHTHISMYAAVFAKYFNHIYSTSGQK